MSASSALKLPHTSGSARLSPAACPICEGEGAVHYCERDPDTGRVAVEGTEPPALSVDEVCEACGGAGCPALLYGGPHPSDVARDTARAYRLHPPRFPLGLLVATPGALALARRHGVDVHALLRRHRSGDRGAVGAADARANDLALDPACPARLLSAYDTPGGPLWVITEADRSATTVLLSSES